METINKFFPFSLSRAGEVKKSLPFKFSCKEETGNLIVCIAGYVIACILLGLIFGLLGYLLGPIPVVGAVVGVLMYIIGSVVELYCLAGIVLNILIFTKVIK